jgi:hypothetical protein
MVTLANRSRASEEISRILRYPKVHHLVYMKLPAVSLLSQMNPGQPYLAILLLQDPIQYLPPNNAYVLQVV